MCTLLALRLDEVIQVLHLCREGWLVRGGGGGGYVALDKERILLIPLMSNNNESNCS